MVSVLRAIISEEGQFQEKLQERRMGCRERENRLEREQGGEAVNPRKPEEMKEDGEARRGQYLALPSATK